MAYQLLSTPVEEPISREEAKAHLRVDFSDDDALISALIGASRQYAEMRTCRQLITARWRLTLDSFPRSIKLDKSPVASVTSIQYLDFAGIWQTMPTSDYVVDASTEPARITPVFGKIWPIPVPQIGSVRIEFVAGYGDASAVPEGIKQWMKLRIGSMYEHRAEIEIIQRAQMVEMPFVDSLLDPFRVVTF